MAKPIHIQILECLQTNNATGSNMVDIKPFFENELNSQAKRKEFKAELDFLVKEKFVETLGKYEFLGWELLDGLYAIDNKKIEARLIGKWETYLASKREIKRDGPIETTFNFGNKPNNIYQAPEKTIGYSLPGDKTSVTLNNSSSKPAADKAASVKSSEPFKPDKAAGKIKPEEELNTLKETTSIKPKEAADRIKSNKVEPKTGLFKRIMGSTANKEADTVKKRPSDELEPIPVKKYPAEPEVPKPETPSSPQRNSNLPSVNDMPPGPLSMASIQQQRTQPVMRNNQLPSVTDMPAGALSIPASKKYNGPVEAFVQAPNATPVEQHIAAENNPFAPLEVIKLSPPKKPDTQWTAANLLKWAVIIVAFILVVLVFKIVKGRG